jgi:DNA-binding NtrC family response regulator
MHPCQILIVDDDPIFLAQLRDALEGFHGVECASSRDEFVTAFRPYKYDLLILDMRLKSGREGLGLARSALEQDPLQPIIVMTAYADTESHIEAINAGALVYLNKTDFSPNFIAEMVDAVLRQGALQRRVAHLERQLDQLEPGDIIGTSPTIEEVRGQIQTAATDGSVTVLVRGESGTGKELVARAVHHWSPRRQNGPFVAVSVAGLHRESIHSDLFGHERGAFTGASSRRKGCLEEAHQGVLFLDEIGDLDPDSQVKLLRVLETRSFARLGGNDEISVELQVVAATHQDLETLIQTGRFRQDLYYRLRSFEVVIPPLRERAGDIPLLAQHFLGGMRSDGRTTARSLDREVFRVLSSAPWPGNVRELRNVIEYAAIQARAGNAEVVRQEHLPAELRDTEEGTKQSSSLTDYQTHLARAELELVERAIALHGTATKTELAKLLGYNDRFTFVRRARRALGKHPCLVGEFQTVAQLFDEGV